jgi:acyl-CoA thioester hydrolase
MNHSKSKKYNYKIQARGYELDSYGHVNNAVYVNYAEQARWQIFNELGLLDQFIASGMKIVVIENHIKYIRQIKLFDEFEIETQMEKSAHFLLFKHILTNTKTKKTLSKVMVKTVFLDENDKPCDIPESLLETFTEA